MSQVEKFGKYLLLDHIADGGMASIRRAKFLDKVVIIKMIKNNLSTDSVFKSMFIDEIKTTFSLNHPNIAQIYDYGEKNEELFCAMEYVNGKNLNEFYKKCKSLKMAFPIDLALHIIAEVCAGLQYTHTFKDDFSGVDPQIIHRDISPSNIMVSNDGNVKIIDFGIAKSSTNSQKTTEVGTIKCNAAYAGPEYVRGEALDHKYDQFSVAVVLWELLTGKRLFASNDTILTLQKVKQCQAPAPSTLNPDVTNALDEIILKALSKDPKDRYEDIETFARELSKELYSLYPGFSPGDLKYFSRYLFKDEIDLEKKNCEALHNQTKQFKFMEEVKEDKPKRDIKKIIASRESQRIKVLNQMEGHSQSKYTTFRLNEKVKFFKLFYTLTISLICGFLLGENYFKEILRAWLFGDLN